MTYELPQIELRRQEWWMQVYQHYLSFGVQAHEAKKGADWALEAFDEQFVDEK